MKLEIDEVQPRNVHQYWCKKCDAAKVDSDKPETGKFFVVFGHAYSQKDRDYSGEYLGVMFAVCKDCLN